MPARRAHEPAPRRLAALLTTAALVASCAGTCAPSSPSPPSEMELPTTTALASETSAPATTARPDPERPPVIDAHTHIGWRAYEVAMKLADENGIERFVNLSGGYQQKNIERHLAAIQRYDGRLAVFYNLAWGDVNEPDFGPTMARGLEAAVKAGYAGLKISKTLGLGVVDEQERYIPVDDPRFDPIWAKAGELGVPVSIHTSDPKAFFEPVTPENERYEELSEAPSWSFADPKYPRREELLAQRDRVVARHPKTTFILVHFANNPEDIDYVDRLLDAHPNAYVDLSARLAEIGRHDPEKVRRLFIKHKERIIFGSDIGVRAQRYKGQYYLSLFLGSISKEPPTLADVKVFFDRHWAFFEASFADVGELSHPVPIQGDWKIKPIDLPREVLQAVYHDNAHRLIFAPMFARKGAPDPLAPSSESPQQEPTTTP